MPQHKKGLRRRHPRKHRGGKHRKSSALPNNKLKIIETIGGNRLIAPQQPYCVWNTLYDSYRAQQLAAAFQEYRITKVTARFIPAYNTFEQGEAGITGGTGKPILYYRKLQQAQVPKFFTDITLKAMGAHGVGWSRQIEFSWKPVVDIYTSAGVTADGKIQPPTDLAAFQQPAGSSTLGMLKKSPWLQTKAAGLTLGGPGTSGIANDSVAVNTMVSPNKSLSAVPHFGVLFYLQVDGAAPPTGTTYGKVEYDYTIEFRKPNVQQEPIPTGYPLTLNAVSGNPIAASASV